MGFNRKNLAGETLDSVLRWVSGETTQAFWLARLLPNWMPSGIAPSLPPVILTCQPTQLSYDHYALMDDGSLRAGYFLNLEQMRRAAKQHALR